MFCKPMPLAFWFTSKPTPSSSTPVVPVPPIVNKKPLPSRVNESPYALLGKTIVILESNQSDNQQKILGFLPK